jgi:hypothetical protein
MRSVKSVLSLALVVIACSDPVGPGNIVGKWQQDFSIPGAFFEMDLTVSGSTISGSGNWCAEAGPCGIVTVAGKGSGNLVQLDLTYTPQVPTPGPSSTLQFRGQLTSRNSLQGALGVGTPQLNPNISYHRA